MGDIDQADASVTKLPHHSEQVLNFSLGERGCWLVHDHQLHVQRAGLRDLDHLLDADAQIPYDGSRIDVQTDHLQPLLRLFAHLVLVDESSGGALSSEENVLRDGEERHQRDLLVYKCDSQLLRFMDSIDIDLLSVNLDGPLILFVDTAEAVHQG